MYEVRTHGVLDSVCFLPLALHKLPKAFGLSSHKSWYPHYFNTKENLEYAGPIPEFSLYGANEMSESKRKVILEWYEGQKGSGLIKSVC
jgi:hypothetical protein